MPQTAPLPAVRVLLADAERQLRAAGVEQPGLDARLLLCHAGALSPEALLRQPDRRLSPAQAATFDRLLARRVAREPVARILGAREFWSLPFALSPAVLDPRPDSETLISAVLAALPDRAASLRLLDLGTGSGCLLIALLRELPAAFGVGLDVSVHALALARANARALGVGDRAAFIAGDWDGALAARAHVVVANPPYVSSAAIAELAPEVARFDPALALDGGDDGLRDVARLIGAMPRLLAAGGVAAIEFGTRQETAVMRLAAARTPTFAAEIIADLAGRPRALLLRAG